MKYFRTAWVLTHMVVSIFVMGSIVLLFWPIDRGRKWVGLWQKIWAYWFLWVAGIKWSVEGAENLDLKGKYIFACNHSSGLDIPLSLATLPGTKVFMAKKELFNIPFFGWVMRGMGCIPVDRKNPRRAQASVAEALKKLDRQNLNLIIYPEGTRSRDGQMLPFKRGGFRMAISSGIPVVPVAISGAYKVLPPKAMSLTPGKIRVTIGEAIPTTALNADDRDNISNQTRATIQAILDRH